MFWSLRLTWRLCVCVFVLSDTPWSPAESSRVRGQRGAEISTIAQSWGSKSLEVKSHQVRKWDSVPWPGKTAGFYLEQQPEDKPAENTAHTVSFLSFLPSWASPPPSTYFCFILCLDSLSLLAEASHPLPEPQFQPRSDFYVSFSPGKKCKCTLQTVIKPKKVWLQTSIKTLNFSRAKDKINKLPWYLPV